MLQLPKTTVWLHYIAALYMGDNLIAIRVCTEPIFFLFYAYHQIQSSQACEAHGRGEKAFVIFYAV